jgi:hypothetical protein
MREIDATSARFVGHFVCGRPSRIRDDCNLMIKHVLRHGTGTFNSQRFIRKAALMAMTPVNVLDSQIHHHPSIGHQTSPTLAFNTHCS